MCVVCERSAARRTRALSFSLIIIRVYGCYCCLLLLLLFCRFSAAARTSLQLTVFVFLSRSSLLGFSGAPLLCDRHEEQSKARSISFALSIAPHPSYPICSCLCLCRALSLSYSHAISRARLADVGNRKNLYARSVSLARTLASDQVY